MIGNVDATTSDLALTYMRQMSCKKPSSCDLPYFLDLQFISQDGRTVVSKAARRVSNG